MISRFLCAACVAAISLLAGALPAEAQHLSGYARVVSINLRNRGEGIVEVRFEDAVCDQKREAPAVAIVRKAQSTSFATTISMLTTALLGNLLVRVQTLPVTCDIQFVWTRRPQPL